MVHSSLESNDTYLYGSEKMRFLSVCWMTPGRSDRYGHTHISFTKQFENSRWAVNCGSVGRSKEENRLASYLLLTMDEEKITPEIIQLAYPVEKTVRQIRESGIPDYYASFLKNENVLIL
ncbi:hypothetical protein EJ377_13650 (plasmid) [Chryseobacterium arthrosphaerae]|uniref:Uncharacterized protein n=1 Tax=Chryseobacterium arthrosphaerae TaxID=651561 RepID=A0A432DY34_9FLAO|nr:hypothetical protein EJ377_13650 [Chryseobacterium arthrosphaerae]